MPDQKFDGIDISHWQAHIDFNAVKKNELEFVFHKATDGRTYVDNRFKERAALIKNTGLIFGAYHFYQPISHGNLNGDQQADHFLDTVIDAVGRDRLFTTVLALDFEKYGINPEDINDVEGGEGDIANMELWFQTLINRLAAETGVSVAEAKLRARVLLYSYHQWTSVAVINSDSIIMESWIKLWAARYYSKLPSVNFDKPLFIWQKSDSQPFQGLTGGLDYNIVMASNEEWDEWLNPLKAQSIGGTTAENPNAKSATKS